MKIGPTFFVLFLLISLNLSAQDVQTTKSVIERVGSPILVVRVQASQEIVKGGYDNPEIYLAVNEAIEMQIPALDKDTPRDNQSDVAWLVKALAVSGDKQFMPLLEELSQSPAKRVASHAKAAQKMLKESSKGDHPYARVKDKRVEVISRNEASSCTYMFLMNCKHSGRCVAWHRDNAKAVGSNAIVMVEHPDNPSEARNESAQFAEYYKCK